MVYRRAKDLDIVTDPTRRYTGMIVSERRFFLPGETFYLQARDEVAQRTYRKKVAKSSRPFDFGSNIPPDERYPVFDSLSFTGEGLEVCVQMTDNGLPNSKIKKIVIPNLRIEK